MKKLLRLIMFLIFVICASPCSVNALTEGDWEYVIQDNEITITNYIGDNSALVIPEYIKGCPVVAIKIDDNRDFRQKIESIYLPETVREIGEYCFWGCNKLKSVNFPESLKSIGSKAFAGCPLETVDLSHVETLGSYAFDGCATEYISLPKTITSIPDGLFESSKLKHINIPNTVERIGSYAFSGSELRTIVIPGSVEVIGATAFGACKNLKSVILSYGTKTLETPRVHTKNTGTFVGCSALEAIYIPETVTDIPRWFVYNLNNVIVYCSQNSYAEEFCKKEGVSYLIDNSINSSIHVLYNNERISFHEYGQNPEIIDGRTCFI